MVFFFFSVLDAFQWWALFGKTGDRETRLYFLIYYNTYLPSWLLALLLREVVIKRGPEDPSCNSLLYTLPSVETVLLAQYYVQGLVHHLHFRLPLTWQMGARAIIVNVFTIGMLWWSGQYGARDLFSGVGIGAALGLFFAFHIFDVWVPRFPLFAASPMWSKWFSCDWCIYPKSRQELEKWIVL